MSLILDIVVIAVLALSVIFGLKKGFIDSIIGFVGLIAAVAVAFWLSNVVADGIYTAVVEPRVKEAIVEAIGDPGASLQEDFAKAEEALPGFVTKLMTSKGVTLSSVAQNAGETMYETAEQMAMTILENVVRPTVTTLIRCIAFLVLFAVLVFLCKFLGKILGKIIKHSPFKGPDKLLGGILGAVKGALWVLLAVTMMQMIAGFSADDALISKTAIEETKVVKAITEINPLYSGNNKGIIESGDLLV